MQGELVSKFLDDLIDSVLVILGATVTLGGYDDPL